MITIGNALLITAGALFLTAGIVYLVLKDKPEPPTYQKPKSYNREPESEYQNLINEHNKL
jgi:hypothetical protein